MTIIEVKTTKVWTLGLGSLLDGQAIGDHLSDDQIKMLNLTRDWLESALPHVLSKIDRVTFGLLSPSDLQQVRIEIGSTGCRS
jgi:hypothetical protein